MTQLAAESLDIVVGFLYVGGLSKIAQIMVASVRAALPHARIVQMSDYATKKVTGVDEVDTQALGPKVPDALPPPSPEGISGG